MIAGMNGDINNETAFVVSCAALCIQGRHDVGRFIEPDVAIVAIEDLSTQKGRRDLLTSAKDDGDTHTLLKGTKDMRLELVNARIAERQVVDVWINDVAR